MTRYHFDGDLVADWKRMVNSQPTGHPEVHGPRYRWTEPVMRKFRWNRLQAQAERILQRMRRAA